MGTLWNALMSRRRYLVIDETDIITVLKVVDEIRRNTKHFRIAMNMEMGICEWTDPSTKWFIIYDATDKQWCSTIYELNLIGYQLVLTDDNRYHLVQKK